MPQMFFELVRSVASHGHLVQLLIPRLFLLRSSQVLVLSTAKFRIGGVAGTRGVDTIKLSPVDSFRHPIQRDWHDRTLEL